MEKTKSSRNDHQTFMANWTLTSHIWWFSRIFNRDPGNIWLAKNHSVC